MSSHVVVTKQVFCTRNEKNLCYCLELLGMQYLVDTNRILIKDFVIQKLNDTFYMEIVNGRNIEQSFFHNVNCKLAEIEQQAKQLEIKNNERLQEEAKNKEESFRLRKLKTEAEQLIREEQRLALERECYIEAKKQAIIAKAKEKGYSVQETVDNGTVKLKLIKRIY